MNPHPDPIAVARCCDRLYRAGAAHRTDATIADVPRGWLRVKPGGDQDHFASTSFNRVHWLTLESPITPEDLAGADRVLRSLGAARAFLWLSAAGAAGPGGEALRAAASPVPYVRYVAVARPAAPTPPPRPTTLHVRRLHADELPGIFDIIMPWFGVGGAGPATAMARAGLAEFFAAFDADKPVAFAGLLVDRAEPFPHGYLGWTGTDPEHRGKGAQSALIAARLARAHELGADWCVSETNTAIDASLRNLLRAGFVPAAEWSVFRWDADPQSPSETPA